MSTTSICNAGLSSPFVLACGFREESKKEKRKKIKKALDIYVKERQIKKVERTFILSAFDLDLFESMEESFCKDGSTRYDWQLLIRFKDIVRELKPLKH